MENKFNELPPLKRFRLMQQQAQQDDDYEASSHLPAKKRKQSRDLPSPTPPTPAAATAVFSLPAKKRVWALQPNLLPSNKPISQFDLNVEYNPLFDNQENKSHKTTDEAQIVQGFEEKKVEKEEEEDGDDGIECAVCQSTDGDPSCPIVFCDGCDLMVHTTCYGSPLIDGVPEGDWFCAQCIAIGNDKKALSCCLCPATGGALKPTTEGGRWAHIVCSLLVPEVFFVDPDGREGIDCSMVPKKRWESSCYICESGNGCAVECSEPKCPLAFHVTCGLKEELCIEYREGRKKGAVVAGFCKYHTELWKKQEQTGKFKIVAREDEHKK